MRFFTLVYLTTALTSGLAACLNFRASLPEARIILLRMAMAALVPAMALIVVILVLDGQTGGFLPVTQETLTGMLVGWSVLNYIALRIACRGVGRHRSYDWYWLSPRVFCLLMSTLYTIPLVLLVVYIWALAEA